MFELHLISKIIPVLVTTTDTISQQIHATSISDGDDDTVWVFKLICPASIVTTSYIFLRAAFCCKATYYV